MTEMIAADEMIFFLFTAARSPLHKGMGKVAGTLFRAPATFRLYRRGWSLAQIRAASLYDPESFGWTPSQVMSELTMLDRGSTNTR